MVQATFSWLGVSATVNFSFLATLTVVSSRQFLFWKCIASKQQLHHSGQISCAFLPHYSDSVEPECSEQFFDGEKSIAVQGIASMMKPWGCPSFETCYHCSVIFGCFWSRFYIVILGMTFFFSTNLLFPIFIWTFYFLFLFGLSFPFSILDFCFPFLFGLLFPFSIWTFSIWIFISFFYLDFSFPFLFRFLFLFLDFYFFFRLLYPFWSLISLFAQIAIWSWISSKFFFLIYHIVPSF